MNRNYLIFTLFIFALFFSSCRSSTERYLFDKPVAFSIQRGVKCSSGSISYMGFVADDTSKYGARIKKISGCASKIDKDFRDKNDKKRGIYVGGRPVSIDQIEIEGEIFIGVGVSGFVKYEKSHEAKDYKDSELPDHRGRLALRKLGTDFEHDPSFDSSIFLDYNPYQVSSYQKEGFIVTGSYFGKFFLSYIPLDGDVEEIELPFFPSDMKCRGKDCYLFDQAAGDLYKLELEELSFELVASGYDLAFPRHRGFNLLSDGRVIIFDGDRIDVLDRKLEVVKTLALPSDFSIVSVSGVKYDESFKYRKFSQEDMFKKVMLYSEDRIPSELPDEEEMPDEETFKIEPAGANDSFDEFHGLPDNIYDDDDESDKDNDHEESDDMTDEDFDDDDTEEEFVYDEEFEELVLDASEGDIIWIASLTGRVVAYDLATESWMVNHFDEDHKGDVPDHFRELRPYIANKYRTFPPHGETDSSNSPDIVKIVAARGLFHSVFYRFSYEGAILGSNSVTGFYDDENSLFLDYNADFNQIGIEPGVDKIVLRGKQTSSKCMIPWSENAVLKIDGIQNSGILDVSAGKYDDQILNCYGENLDYSIFPGNMYSATIDSKAGNRFAGRAAEYQADEKNVSDASPSFSDQFVSVWIQRETDEIETEKEFSIFLRIRPGIPFTGFSSNDIMEQMVSPSNGRILMFSPLTRRFVEFNLINGNIVKIYK